MTLVVRELICKKEKNLFCFDKKLASIMNLQIAFSIGELNTSNMFVGILVLCPYQNMLIVD